MIRAALFEVPGAPELVGRGNYTALPDELPGMLTPTPCSSFHQGEYV